MSAAAARAHDRLMHIHPGAAADLPSDADPRPSVHHLQKRISTRVTEALSARLLADLPDTRSKAQYISHCQDPYTFSALPTCPELTIDNKLLPLSIARRLLLPTTTCTCEAHQCVVCTSQADILGDHSLLCFSDGNPHRRTLWHDASYRVWGAMLKSVGFSVRIEPSNALLSDSGKRPDLIIHDNAASSSPKPLSTSSPVS